MSKFDRLFRVAKADEGPEQPEEETMPTTAVTPAPAPLAPAKRKSANLVAAPPTGKKARAEPAKISGKRQHPDFVGLTTYIRKDVHRRVKIALLVEGQNRELSELVDELLAAWLVKKEK